MWCVAARVTIGGQQNVAGLTIDKSSIGGTVVNTNGKPEAGVWVIAETKSLQAPFRKIVVTDDQGRYLVPDLPAADYELWVRGYGLKDSEHVKGARGANVKLQVANAATPQEAAKIYPASYWTSMIKPPAMEDLPPRFKSQDEWLATLRNGCNHCHALGMPQTRIYTTAKDWDAMFLRAQSMHLRLQTEVRTGADLVPDINFRCGVIANQDRGQPRRDASRTQCCNARPQLIEQLARDYCTVNQGGRHSMWPISRVAARRAVHP